MSCDISYGEVLTTRDDRVYGVKSTRDFCLQTMRKRGKEKPDDVFIESYKFIQENEMIFFFFAVVCECVCAL